TLEALFQGKQELFKGLWIGKEGRWDWSKKHPVIRLDMSLVDRKDPDRLEQGLCAAVEQVAAAHQIQLRATPSPCLMLQRLIGGLHAQHGDVVVLVDEYDKPLIDHLGGRNKAQRERELELADANRIVLRDFYTVLKGMSGKLRLVFVTGVSKFTKVSIFSDLNHLTDLTLARDCATLLGYTQQELETNFASHLQKLADEQGLSVPEVLTQIKRWYDGFRFSSRDVHVYNPFSTLLLLRHKEFRAHWFQTGTPSFLVHLIKRVNKPRPESLVGAKVDETSFDSCELHKLPQNLLPLMVQTGYLTIADYNAATRRYTLDYPNHEVREGFLKNLLESLANLPKGQVVTDLDRLTDALAENDLGEFFVALRSVLAGVPYELHVGLEKYYQSLFYLIHALLGFRIQTEVSTNTGRIDAVIDLEQHTYVFEFKLEQGIDSSEEELTDPKRRKVLQDSTLQAQRAAELADGHKKLAQAALRQIKDKQYHAKYLGKGKPITLVGCVFTVNDMQGRPVRQATAWVSEEL
ncbi:MAG: AAA family ATPase, partial [Myxococcota bacterium]